MNVMKRKWPEKEAKGNEPRRMSTGMPLMMLLPDRVTEMQKNRKVAGIYHVSPARLILILNCRIQKAFIVIRSDG